MGYEASLASRGNFHDGKIFKAKFFALAEMCSDSKEFGYDMLWQGAAESES